MKLKEFNFQLPEDRIARFPSMKRDESKLMMVNRKTGEIFHYRFRDIVELTDKDDFFVVNNSRVMPVRLFGSINDKSVEMLIVNDLGNNEVEVLARPAKYFKLGERVVLMKKTEADAQVIGFGYRGRRTLRLNVPMNTVLETGYAPLPPYIKRKFDEAEQFRALDLERYQTVYSKNPGSIAAPTAGLHFTPEIIAKIRERSEMIEVTLEVGETTFQKIEVDDISHHQMGKEWITISKTDRGRILDLKKSKRLTAVGTTSVRSLETWAQLQPEEERFSSNLFISPGYEFQLVDRLITNLHLPESSLFILVCAFAGVELMHNAYRIAIEHNYRFFSYGDAMLIV
ncbi:MAG: tRNA preQ1(34) S-adenosylmethionine ribosyltransferase-isomerase QueA [Candidatus Omnitrophota bacterium]